VRLVHSNSDARGFDLAKIAIQSKMEISRPGDEYEQEANRVMHHVMRMPSPLDLVM
jgi:hypothetical protein